MVGFKGSTQEERHFEIFRFGYRKAANDKMVPDPVGSGFLYYINSPNDNRLASVATSISDSLQIGQIVTRTNTRALSSGGENEPIPSAVRQESLRCMHLSLRVLRS